MVKGHYEVMKNEIRMLLLACDHMLKLVNLLLRI